MTIGQSRRKTKKAAAAEIELLTADYLANGGKVKEIETKKSESRPNWANYSEMAMSGGQDE